MITNIIDLMRALDYVQGTQSLSAAEKAVIASELKASLPAKALCHGAHLTHDIAAAVFDKAASTPARINGPTTGESSSQTPKPEENRKEGHQLAGLRPVKDGVPRDDRKAYGGAKKVARSG